MKKHLLGKCITIDNNGFLVVDASRVVVPMKLIPEVLVYHDSVLEGHCGRDHMIGNSIELKFGEKEECEVIIN